MAGRLPGVGEIEQLMARGLSQGQIAERYGVGPAAVSAALARAGKARDRRWYPTLIPWSPVRTIHSGSYDLRMLRTEGQLRAGHPVPEWRRRKLAGWKAALERDHTVIHYDPDTAQGFFRVPRRDGRDTDLVRVPDGAAAGPPPAPGRRRRRSNPADGPGS